MLIQNAYYGDMNVLAVPMSRSLQASESWKSILKVRPLFNVCIESRLENVERTLYWIDCWFEGNYMQDLFPNLFRFTLSPNITVHEFFHAAERQYNFRDPLNSTARLEFNHLQILLGSIHLPSDTDTLRWRWTANEIFSISSAYKFFIHSGMISWFPLTI